MEGNPFLEAEAIRAADLAAQDAATKLAMMDTDGNPMTPDGKTNDTFNKDWAAHVKGSPLEAPEPVKSEDDAEIVDEAETVSKLTGGRFSSVDELAQAYQGITSKASTLGELLAKTNDGYRPSDDVIQDLMDVAEQAALRRQPSFLGGGGAPAAPAAAPLGAPPAPSAPMPAGQHTNEFLRRYGSTLKWNDIFLQDMARALSEHLPQPEAPKVDGFVSRQDMDALGGLIQNIFRDRMVDEHIISRLQSGEKLPRDYRARLISEVQKNPSLQERAWRSYVLRGNYNGVMDDYARNLMAERDPKTGLTAAEGEAMAEEQRRATSSRKVEKGAPTPAAPKKKEPSVRDLERQLEDLGKKIL